jgi:polar amino acid transport system substrate-binding protein
VRDEYAVLSAPIAPQVWTWYFPRDAAVQPGDANFKASARVTATSGSNMAAFLGREGYRMEGETRSPEQLVVMLRAGRVDAVLANSVTFDEALRGLGQSPQSFASRVERSEPLGVYFGRHFLQRQPGFLESFNTHVPFCAVR